MAGVRQPGKHEGHEKNADGEPNGGKRAKKERPRVPHKAKVSEPQTVIRSPRNQLTTPGARCQARFCDLGATSPPWGAEGGNLSFFQVAAALAAKLAATHPAVRRKGRRKSRPRSAAKRLGLDFRLTLWQSARVAPSQRPEGGQRARLSIVRNAHHR